MSDDTTTPETTPEVTTPVQETAKTYTEDYVKELRNEAAKYRNEKKTAVEQAKAALDTEWQAKLAGTSEKVTTLETSLGDAWVEVAKIYAAIEARVPSDKILSFASLLKGTTDDEISESAKSAKELFGGLTTSQPATDPTQGSGGGALPLNGDPILAALKKAVGG